MHLHKSSSKVQFQRRPRQPKKSEDKRTRFTKSELPHAAIPHGRRSSKGPIFDIREEAEPQNSNDAPKLFSKRCVSSIEETVAAGSLMSGLSQALSNNTNASTTTICSGTSNTFAPSPWSSLVFEAAPQEPTKIPPAEQSSSLLLRIITLFGGRRQKRAPDRQFKRSQSEPAPQSAVHNSLADVSQAPIHPLEAPRPPQPRLPLFKAIPRVPTPGSTYLNNIPAHNTISPAPPDPFRGYVNVVPSRHPPGAVQRGFEIAHHASAPLETNGLAQRRCMSSASLLDRKGDVWANWHTKNPGGLY